MPAPFPSYVCSVLLASHLPTYGFTAVQRHWRRLVTSPSDPYRPELHYMRGSGRRQHTPGKGAVRAPANFCA